MSLKKFLPYVKLWASSSNWNFDILKSFSQFGVLRYTSEWEFSLKCCNDAYTYPNLWDTNTFSYIKDWIEKMTSFSVI